MPCSTKPSYTNQASKQYKDTNKWLPNIWIIAGRVIWRDNSYTPSVTLSKILVSEDLNYLVLQIITCQRVPICHQKWNQRKSQQIQKQLIALYSSPTGTCQHSNTGMKKTSPYSLINSSQLCSNSQTDAKYNASYHATVNSALKERKLKEASEVTSQKMEKISHPLLHTIWCTPVPLLLDTSSSTHY